MVAWDAPVIDAVNVNEVLAPDANAPIAFRFIALFKQQGQLVKAFDRASARLWNRHRGDSAYRNFYPSQVAPHTGQVKTGLMKFPAIALPDEK